MSLSSRESLTVDFLAYLPKYSFFVKTFIVWAFISIPWNITSFMVLKMESSNRTKVNYTCYEKIEDMSSWVDAIQFWLRGIIPTVISTLGIIFNFISFIVLKKCEGNEVFKKLLMSLGMKPEVKELKTIKLYVNLLSACIDCFYLFNQLCDNLNRNVLKCEEKTLWCAIIPIYLIYPASHAAIMMTIYTVVVLSFERLHAICSPLTHIPKFWPYFITILFSSITMIIPLFFHHQLVHDDNGSITFTDCVCKLNVIYNITFHTGVLIIGNSIIS